MSIMPSTHKGHRERLKKRFQLESSALQDYEVLELLLAMVFVRKDTKPLAKALIERCGSLRGVLDAIPEVLRSVDGVGAGVETLILLLRETRARYLAAPLIEREQACSPQAVAIMAKARLTGTPHEEIWVALVDNQNRLIAWERVSKGSISTSPLYPRDVLALALKFKASGFVLVHNHPGGNARPSSMDVDMTAHMDSVAEIMGLRFLDHVIVTEGACFSIRQDDYL